MDENRPIAALFVIGQHRPDAAGQYKVDGLSPVKPFEAGKKADSSP